MNKVSVIIPCFNCEKYIAETIDSILNQTYPNSEFIFVNDGSTDKTKEIISLRKMDDDRIILINKENGGVSSARNTGLRYATGDFIVFLDADDILLKDSLELQLKYIVSNNADVCFGTFKTFDGNYDLTESRNIFEVQYLDHESILKELSICKKIQNFFWGKMYKKTVIADFIFDENIRIWEDIRENCKILDLCESGVLLDTPVVLYRLSSNSLSKSLDKEKIDDFCRAQIDKANFYLTKYPKLAKYHSESMFQCGAEVLSRNLEKTIESFNDFMITYKKVIQKSGLRNKLRYFLIRHKGLYRVFSKK